MIDERPTSPWLDELGPEDLDVLRAELEARTVTKGDAVVRQGERADTLGFVTEGVLDVTTDVGGARLDFADLGPGAAFGADGVVEPGPSPVTLTATSDAAYLALTREAFERDLRRRRPAVASKLLLAIARDAARRVRRATAVSFVPDEAEGDVDVESSFEALIDDPGEAPPPVSWLSKTAGAARAFHERADETQVRDMLLAIEALAPLGTDLLKRLGRHLDVRTYAAGQVIVAEGDVADGLYLLLRGSVDVVSGARGDFVARHGLEPGRVFGAISFLLETPRTATCRASAEATVGILGPAQVLPLIEWGERGGIQGALAMEWIAREVIEDGRRLHRRLVRAFEARPERP